LTNSTVDVSLQARSFFTTLGVDLTTTGKSIFFNDRLGELFVRATQQDLDTIEDALEVLNRVAPQVHIKARFIEIDEGTSSALGFDWYLGNYVNGNVVANGGSAPSLNVPVSSANPLGTFPGNTAASQIAGSATDQLLTSGLRNPLNAPALTTITGIMTDPNFRVVINALQQSTGAETLAEPEVVTTSGRQTQMRATQIQTIVTGSSFQEGTAATTTGTTTP
jgi:general secretion pathway protein D